MPCFHDPSKEKTLGDVRRFHIDLPFAQTAAMLLKTQTVSRNLTSYLRP